MSRKVVGFCRPKTYFGESFRILSSENLCWEKLSDFLVRKLMLGKVFGVYRPKSYVGERGRILSSDNLLARLPMQPAQCMATTMHETLTIITDSDLALIAAGEEFTAAV